MLTTKASKSEIERELKVIDTELSSKANVYEKSFLEARKEYLETMLKRWVN